MTLTESASFAQIPKETLPEQYDLVVLGDGTRSTLAAWTFAGDRKRVAVIERKFIGGSCPNIACLPSKNIIDSAKIATYFRGAERGGIAKPGSAIDMRAVLARKRRMVRVLNEMYLENFKRSGAELILGVGEVMLQEILQALRPWMEGPLTITYRPSMWPSVPSSFKIAQYSVNSVEDAKRKLIQFPSGTHFIFAIEGETPSSDTNTVFQELADFAAKNGLQLRRNPQQPPTP